jgi:hypothetical protein
MGEAIAPATPALTPQEEKAEVARIVPRLEAIAIRHLESARHVGIELGRAEMLRVVDALQAEAAGQPPGPLHDDEIKRFAMESLYEELLAEPSNIFRHTQVDAATTRYEAMPRSFWQACLAELKTRCAG